jgi:hypothetical protein
VPCLPRLFLLSSGLFASLTLVKPSLVLVSEDDDRLLAPSSPGANGVGSSKFQLPVGSDGEKSHFSEPSDPFRLASK